jgi:uncharacterized protein (DUF58 family)
LKRLQLAAGQRLRAWAARRHGGDVLPLAVHVRRIYIVPTGFGLVLGVLVASMLLAGLNYNSNLGLAFAFLIASIALVGMHHTHRNLLGLRVNADRETDCCAGARATWTFLLENPSPLDRWDVEVRVGADAAVNVAVAACGLQQAAVALDAPRRGVLRIPQFALATRYPFGWFRAWTYVQAPLIAYVAPRPAGAARRPVGSARPTGGGAAVQTGDEEFAGLRGYTPGVPLKHMAWKVLARGGEAAVRSYAGSAADPDWLEWDDLPELEPEARLSQLCRWVLDCDAGGRPYGLRIPGRSIEPAQGEAHRRACLRVLAAHGLAAA